MVEKIGKLEERKAQQEAHGGARKKTPPPAEKKEEIPPTEKKDDVPPQTEEKVHPHVVCDNCNSQIVGNRFKCSLCPDFDLCSGCEGTGIHSHHSMIRIANPKDKSWRVGGIPGE